MSLDKAFASTCRVLFGKEVGPLSRYSNYLAQLVDQPMHVVSKSGKKISLSQPFYCKGANFIEESEISGKESLSINDVKDIDSVFEAISEKFAYCGNKLLGTIIDVNESDMCNDSISVLSSSNIISSKFVAYSNGIRQSEYVFGCQLGGEVGQSIRSQIFFYSKRCFEVYLVFNCTDIYYSFNCRHCTNAMFCFNQVSKHYMIGNLPLQKEEYLALKSKLTAEIAGELERKGKLASLFELAGGVLHA